jgi:hypothetical protein
MKRPEDDILLRDMVDHARRAERSWPIRSKTGCSSAFARARGTDPETARPGVDLLARILREAGVTRDEWLGG